jgi:hypothetical protein
MRPVTALFCLGLCVPLAGCLTPGPSGDATPELAAAPAAPPSAPTMPAGRGATAPKPAAAAPFGKDEDWWMQGGVTREKINGMCWMKYESGRKDLPVEKRADLVNQCVIEKKKEYPFVN